jgi:hypothetical protein
MPVEDKKSVRQSLSHTVECQNWIVLVEFLLEKVLGTSDDSTI